MRWPGLVRVIAEENLPVQRRLQGWSLPDFGAADLIVAPASKDRARLANEATGSNAVNLFSGIDAYPETYRTLKRLAGSRAMLGVMVEPGRHNDGWRALLRRFKHRGLAWRWRRRLDLVLATGDLGCVWWQSAGFPANKVFPFGYFTAQPDENLSAGPVSTSEKPVFRMLFVGQLIHRKGLDLLFHALSKVSDKKWALDIIGKGPQEESYMQLAEKKGFNARIYWWGALPNAQVLACMAQADLFILPSRYDGWGAVVNEALTMGTPVLASDACGASCLLTADWLGMTFSSENTDSLVNALQECLARGPLPENRRIQIRKWAKNSISPEAAADYLIQILQRTGAQSSSSGLRPPWESVKQPPIDPPEKASYP